MKKLVIPFIVLVITSCGNNTKPTESQDKTFDVFKEAFVEELWKNNPEWASYNGYYKYDSVLSVPDENYRKAQLAFSSAWLDSLKKFDVKQLSSSNKTDYLMIENQLKSNQFYINEFKSYEWNPSNYNLGETFAKMINEQYAPLDERLRNFYKRLVRVDAYYAAAKSNIKQPTIVHTNLAISQNRGAAEVFGAAVIDSIDKSGLSAQEKVDLKTAVEEAKQSVLSYADWLEKDILPTLNEQTARSFRLGKELFTKKFDYEITSSYSAEQIYNKALEHKKNLHAEMAKLTKQLWPKYFKDKTMPTDSLLAIKEMIGVLSLKHVHRDSFQYAIEQQIPELTKFVKDKDLLYLDPSKPLVVRVEPAYMQGVAGASISSPGPYEKNANTYYNVGPLTGYSPEAAESYLREYNHYMLQILNIHEAIPGHYAQLVYSNQSPSIIKSILGNGAMVEGWAVYTERMMLEEGYGNNEPEMWLIYYKWNLRATCNTILDYSIHTANMSEEDAMKLMVNEGFQQEKEAANKWKRANLTQVQLCSYFTGFREIYDFREEVKKQQGDRFKLKVFHEKFLSYGSAPVKYIRELMLEDLKEGSQLAN
ncbi:MAG: hypothetical protein POELPBGB_03078 [Bacteroidia bacterium]|nr:hypothetical protein [Bacteroidia bacterium]